MNEFDSAFCHVAYIESDDVVLLTWKKFACAEDYRQPTTFAWELLRAHEGSRFVVDARNGFEDDPADVEWGFSVLIPGMAKTGCKKVAFLMNKANGIEEEMSLWAREFGKYFAVYRAETYRAACFKMKHMLWVDVKYSVKPGKRDTFYARLLEEGVVAASRQESGNYRYDYAIPLEQENELWLTEIWTDEAAQEQHARTAHFSALALLKQEYVERTCIHQFYISEEMDSMGV